MSIKKINKAISQYGEIQKTSKYGIYSYTDLELNDQLLFEYRGKLSDLERLIGSKDPSETLKNKLHFKLVNDEFKVKNSDEESEDDENFEFASELMKAPDRIVQLFSAASEFLDMIVDGHSNACVISGMSQIGKSTFVMNKLQEARKKITRATQDIILLKGASSPMALYDFIYANKEKIIVIDDCDSVFSDEKGLNVLKAVLDPQEERKVCWISGQAAVSEFIFEGRVVFISNYSFFKMRKNKNYKHMIAVINRSDYIEIDGNSNQVFEYIKHIEEYLYPNKDIRKQISKYLEDIVSKYNVRITPQLFKDLCRIREFKASKFEQLAKVKLMALMLN